jgi:DNA polymerase-3 subunit epsilon
MGIGPIVDPFVIDKHLDKFRRGKRNLGATCEHYGVPLEDAHTSTGDSLAAARLAWRLAQVFPDEVGNRDLEALHADQAVWRATWAADFQSYLQRQGKDELVDGQWPLRVAA